MNSPNRWAGVSWASPRFLHAPRRPTRAVAVETLRRRGWWTGDSVVIAANFQGVGVQVLHPWRSFRFRQDQLHCLAVFRSPLSALIRLLYPPQHQRRADATKFTCNERCSCQSCIARGMMMTSDKGNDNGQASCVHGSNRPHSQTLSI